MRPNPRTASGAAGGDSAASGSAMGVCTASATSAAGAGSATGDLDVLVRRRVLSVPARWPAGACLRDCNERSFLLPHSIDHRLRPLPRGAGGRWLVADGYPCAAECSTALLGGAGRCWTLANVKMNVPCRDAHRQLHIPTAGRAARTCHEPESMTCRRRRRWCPCRWCSRRHSAHTKVTHVFRT